MLNPQWCRVGAAHALRETWAEPTLRLTCEVVAAGHLLRAGDLDEDDGLGLTRLEAHRRPRGDIEAFAGGGGAVELQARIRFAEVVMAADLHRAVAHVGDVDRHAGAAGVEFDLARLAFIIAGERFAR